MRAISRFDQRLGTGKMINFIFKIACKDDEEAHYVEWFFEGKNAWDFEKKWNYTSQRLVNAANVVYLQIYET
jgi:hypothetical protein